MLFRSEQALVDAQADLEEKKKLDASTSNMHKFLRVKAEKGIKENVAIMLHQGLLSPKHSDTGSTGRVLCSRQRI